MFENDNPYIHSYLRECCSSSIDRLMKQHYNDTKKVPSYWQFLNKQPHNPKNSEKGNTYMSNVQVEDIIALASQSTEDSSSMYDGLPENLKELIKEELDIEQRKKARSSARQIVSWLTRAEEEMTQLKRRLAAIRREEAAVKAHIVRLGSTVDYAKESNNYVPMLINLGMVNPRDFPPELREVKTKAAE